MNPFSSSLTRRDFARRMGQLSLLAASARSFTLAGADSPARNVPEPVLTFPGPWRFQLPAGSLILVSDQQLEDLQDPDREVDLSLSATPNRTTLRKVCQQQQAQGSRKLILAFDHFWAQYRPGQGETPRQLMPDTDEYLQKMRNLSATLKSYQLGLELSLLSPLELGPGFLKATGEQGRWVQYREGLRDPKTGRFEVQAWEHRLWTNNKGSIEVKRDSVRVFAYRERRLGGTPYYVVKPDEVVELKEKPIVEEWEGAVVGEGKSFAARRLTVRGQGDLAVGGLNRVLVVISYQTPEMDYFSARAPVFLRNLVDRYHAAEIPLVGLYADEMHIQQDWVYHAHHDEGQFTLRYLTRNFARVFAERYGSEYNDLDKYLVYFCYGQHSFLSSLEPRLAAQHVMGDSPEDVQRTFLLRRRYYDLLGHTVVGLFAGAKQYAEEVFGHELEARAHATWAQSPTIDAWDTGNSPHAPKQYDYTPNFLWGNTVQQAAAACDDYFLWNDFLTGGGNDHAEGGWSDRDYYALALACSTGSLNRTPYAYAAHWGMPGAVSERRQALVDAYGASASPAFQAIENSEHREVEVLMLYPSSLVAVEERFGSWMTQYGYANYVTADRLLQLGRITTDGQIELAGRRYRTLVALFEPLPPGGLIPLLEKLVAQGGRLVWSGPPPYFDLAAASVRETWQKLLGIRSLNFRQTGLLVPGELIQFDGLLKRVPSQMVLTSFIVDHIYPVESEPAIEVVARSGANILGIHRVHPSGGSTTYLGFRPRDDQSASLGYEVRTWYEVLKSLGAYPPSRLGAELNDNPVAISRETPYLSCRFPNGAITIAAHYRHHVESWPGGFHRNQKDDDASLARNPLPSDKLELRDFIVQGYRVSYQGRLLVAFRLSENRVLAAFGGYNCSAITVDGTEHRFADRPLAHLAWAPVAEGRRVPGGAIMEIWAAGDAVVRIPLPTQTTKPHLFMCGPRPGACGREIPITVEDQKVVFTVSSSWPTQHLYLCAES
jgi:hypothetical protein